MKTIEKTLSALNDDKSLASLKQILTALESLLACTEDPNEVKAICLLAVKAQKAFNTASKGRTQWVNIK